MRPQPALVSLRHPSGATAQVSTQGAQTLSWCSSDGVERLYLSPKAVRDGHSAVRGGIPLCFPQFNQRVIGEQPQPKHGFARNLVWTLKHSTSDQATFSLSDNQDTRRTWAHAFEAIVRVRLDAQQLHVGFELLNRGGHPLAFALALHTYLAVQDIHQAQLLGLENQPYWDAVAHASKPHIKSAQARALRFGAETDQVYANAPREVTLVDGTRRLRISASPTLPDVVVWNPGQVLCGQLSDLPPDGWQGMLCVEAAAIEVPLVVAAGSRWAAWQALEAL